jgi:hypothetical protein
MWDLVRSSPLSGFSKMLQAPHPVTTEKQPENLKNRQNGRINCNLIRNVRFVHRFCTICTLFVRFAHRLLPKETYLCGVNFCVKTRTVLSGYSEIGALSSHKSTVV